MTFPHLNVLFQVVIVLASLTTGRPTSSSSYQWRHLGPRSFNGHQSSIRGQLTSLPARPSSGSASLLRTESEKTFKLVTELALLGAKHVVTAVAQMANIDPEKKAKFESTGLAVVTPEETKRLNSLLRELGELGADASTSLAKHAEGLARTAGLSRKKAEQVAKFTKLVPLISGLADLGGEISSSKKSSSTGSGLEILESIGLDLETGLAFLKENNLDISDGLKLLGGLSGDDGGASLKSLNSLSQLLGIGSLSLGASGGASALKSVETPELRAQLEETNELLVELAELGTTYVIAAVSELPGLSEEKQRRYKAVGVVGITEKARLNSLLVELGELGAKASIAATEAGANVPGLARLSKLVPILTGLAELASVSDSEDAESNLAATRAVFSSPSLNRAANPFGGQAFSGFVHPATNSKVVTPELRAQSTKTIKLVTELAEVGAKYVVSAVVDLPNVDPGKKALFEEMGLVGITDEEKATLNSLLLELGKLGSEASITVAEAAASVARTAGLSRKKSAQIAKFAKLVPILKGLTDLAGDTATGSDTFDTDAAGDDAFQLLDTIGLDLGTGLDFLKKNNLDISDGLALLDAAIGDTSSFSLKGLGSASQLLGVGSLSLGATGGASAIKNLESPELRAKLEKTNNLLTELAELGAVYVVSALAELPTISPEKRRRYKKVGTVGKKEEARLNSVLVELGELGSDVSVRLTEVGAEVPGLAKLAKLVLILTTLAELSFVSDSGDAQANRDATENVFSTSSISSARLSSGGYYGGSPSHCKGHPCIFHPRGGFSAVPRGFPFKLRRFVRLL